MDNKKNINNMINILEPLIKACNQIAIKTARVVASDFMKSFSGALISFANDIENAKNNPNSYFNYVKYQDELDNMHWAWPYEINAEELKFLLENGKNEKEFDDLMNKFFKNEKVNKMFQEIERALPRHHKMMLKQVKNAFDREDYAIANNALMSIIDNMLSVYLKNKGKTTRYGILRPIISYYSEYPLDEVEFIFELYMLSNNIDFIFQDYCFSDKIEIETNKKIRRHTSLHGVRYSNKRIDTLLLSNTLVNLTKMEKILREFRGGLIYKNKRFCFSDSKQCKLEEKKYKEIILDIIITEKQVEHKIILQRIDSRLSKDIKEKGKFVSNLLQKMKKSDKIIKCEKIDGRNYWMLW